METQPWTWLYVVCFLDLLGASMIMPVFSSHLRSLGISHVNIGLLSSLYGFTQLISGPIIGSWSDLHGRRSILCLSMVVCCAAYGLIGIASSFYFLLLIRCTLGTFKHTQTLCRAFIADIVPAEKQSSVLGLVNAFTSFSFMIGPTISGHIMEIENGFQYLSVTVLIIFALNATVIFFFGSPDEIKNREKKNIIRGNRFFQKISLVFEELCSIDWKRFWALFAIKFLFALSAILFFQNMGLILTENYEITSRYMGYTISFYGFISVLCNLSAGRLQTLEFLPKSSLIRLKYTISIMTVTFIILYIANSYTFFVIGLIPLSSSHALTRILLTELVLEQSDPSFRGSMVGASSSIVAIARIIAPFLSGLIFSWCGLSAVLLVSSIIALSAFVLTVIYSQQIREKIE